METPETDSADLNKDWKAVHSARYILEDLNHERGHQSLADLSGLPIGVITAAFQNIFPQNVKAHSSHEHSANVAETNDAQIKEKCENKTAHEIDVPRLVRGCYESLMQSDRIARYEESQSKSVVFGLTSDELNRLNRQNHQYKDPLQNPEHCSPE